MDGALLEKWFLEQLATNLKKGSVIVMGNELTTPDALKKYQQHGLMETIMNGCH